MSLSDYLWNTRGFTKWRRQDFVYDGAKRRADIKWFFNPRSIIFRYDSPQARVLPSLETEWEGSGDFRAQV